MPLSPNDDPADWDSARARAAPIIAARMLTRFIWNADTPVNSAARARAGAGAFSRTLRRCAREGVEVQRQADLVDRLPQRLPDRMPHRLHVPRARQLEPAQPHLGDAVDLLHRRARCRRRAGRPGRSGGRGSGCRSPSASRCRCGTSPWPPRGRCSREAAPRMPKMTSASHAVHLHVLDAQMRIGRRGGCPSCRRRRGRPRPSCRPGSSGPARASAPPGPTPPISPNDGAVLARPVRPVGPVRDVRHALPHRGRGVRP